jgi:hypothetical protein
MKYADFGAVLHGTLKDDALLNAFADELEYHTRRNKRELSKDDRARYKRLVERAREIDTENLDNDDFEFGVDLVHSLIDALNGFAPPNGYFGAHPGDGAVGFGFWPSRE